MYLFNLPRRASTACLRYLHSPISRPLQDFPHNGRCRQRCRRRHSPRRQPSERHDVHGRHGRRKGPALWDNGARGQRRWRWRRRKPTSCRCWRISGVCIPHPRRHGRGRRHSSGRGGLLTCQASQRPGRPARWHGRRRHSSLRNYRSLGKRRRGRDSRHVRPPYLARLVLKRVLSGCRLFSQEVVTRSS